LPHARLRQAPPFPYTTLFRSEARSVFARSLGFAFAAIPVPVLGGAMGTVPALTGVALFAVLLLAVERGLAAHHPHPRLGAANRIDRKSTRLNSSHLVISYAVF